MGLSGCLLVAFELPVANVLNKRLRFPDEPTLLLVVLIQAMLFRRLLLLLLFLV